MDAPNPVLIMVINMTIVFVVLYILGLSLFLCITRCNRKPKIM